MSTSARISASEKIYFAGLLLLTVALPFSNFLMSVSQFVLVAAWLLGGDYVLQLRRFTANKPALVFAAFYLLHLIGMLYTLDFNGGMNDLRVKLPLLILPFLVAGMPVIPTRIFKIILAVFVACVLSQTILLSIKPELTGEFISPIRFSMMVSFSVFVLIHLGFSQSLQWIRIVTGMLACWLVIFLVQFPFDTGIVTLVCALFCFILMEIARTKIAWVKAVFSLGVVALVVFTFVFIKSGVNDFYRNSSATLPAQDEFTAQGEKYVHDAESKDLENGNYVWRYVARTELERAWNERSSRAFNDFDSNGQPLNTTLIRFLTSKGFRKDAEGVNKLTPEEIDAIERGTANVRYLQGMNLSNRLYETIWSIHQYRIGAGVQRNSILQRFEYWHTGWQVFTQARFVGHGTGSVLSALQQQYEKSHSALEKSYRLKTHNQYLSTAIALGSFGVALLVFCFLFPVILERRWLDTLLMVFLVIVLAAMFVEDTLETQAGVTFVAFFISLLLFSSEEKMPANLQ